MKIHYLNGRRLCRAMKAGAESLMKKMQHLNDINVFPVPDGDTGTNMASTVKKIAEDIDAEKNGSIGEVSRRIANSALEGSRGNSGAILAQFFQGLSEGLKGKMKISTEHFAEAVRQATERSYEALSNPKEGTILSVLRDWGKHVQEKSKETKDFTELMKSSLSTARKSLKKTSKQLKELQKAGVVDAGAQGFVYMLEGITQFIDSGKIEDIENLKLQEASVSPNKQASINFSTEAIAFRYCTEFFLFGENISRTEIRKKLESMGDSLIVAGSDSRVRVHIHTNNPRKVFDAVLEYGEIKQQKVDDMHQQHTDVHDETAQSKIALLTDTSCDLPESLLRKYNIHMVPLRVFFDGVEFLDKITIFPEEFYERLKKAKAFPKTSQPTPQDFLRVYQQLTAKFETIFSVHLAGKLSGTLQAAKMAAKEVIENTGKKIYALDSRNTSVGLGLVMIEAGEAIRAGKSPEKVLQVIRNAVNNLQIFVSTDTVKYLVMGGRVSKSKGFFAKLFNLVPVITLTKEGKTYKVATAKKGTAIREKLLSVLEKKTRGCKNRKFAIVHVAAPKIAEWYAKQIQERFGQRSEFIMEASPALGAHAGPGAAAVAVLSSFE